MLLFVGVPGLIFLSRNVDLGFRLPWVWVMVVAALGVIVWLVRFAGLRRREFWKSDDPAAEKAMLKRILLRFVPAALVLTALTAWLLPDSLFNLPRQRPSLWIGIATFYPLFSVYPQELLFRLFFFKRYESLFADRRALIAVNAVLFGWAHVFFPTPVVAVGLCILGGILFADTYARTRSLRLVWFEHALYGVLVFTIGLGEFFFSGRRVQ
jgi:uncharacterized protein